MGIVWISVLSMGGIGLILAIVLFLSDRFLRVEVDPRVENVLEALPGANCGGCGAIGCQDYAEKVVAGELPVMGCKPGGGGVAEQIAGILGADIEEVEKQIAVVHCGAKGEIKTRRAEYKGILTCRAVNALGGDVACSYGCLGYGDCFDACPFDAIRMVEGLPHIDREKCVACGACTLACPRGIISLERFDERRGQIVIACSSQDRGRDVRRICKVGCIGCRLCERNCSDEAFKVENDLARIDYAKVFDCEHWDLVIEKCRQNTIVQIPTTTVAEVPETEVQPSGTGG